MASNLEIWPEIEPIEDNIEHEDSFDRFDTLESFRSIDNCDWSYLVFLLLALFFVLFYIFGLGVGIFHWKTSLDDIYY